MQANDRMYVHTNNLRRVRPFNPLAKAADDTPGLGRDYLAKGRFGTGLNAAYAEAEAARVLPAYKSYPLTVELWCKLNSSGQYNILVAHEPKESAEHWEIYTENGKGHFERVFPRAETCDYRLAGDDRRPAMAFCGHGRR